MDDSLLSFTRTALKGCPPDDPERAFAIGAVAICLSNRYKVLKNMEDLEESISLYRNALSLRPPTPPSRHHNTYISIHIRLASALYTRYEMLGENKDLDESISVYQDLLATCPPAHPERVVSLGNLATYLSTRYTIIGKKKDLEDSISLHRTALTLCPPSHPDRVGHLSNLASSLSMFYEGFGNMKNLEEAILLKRTALSLCPADHPGRATSLHNLSDSLSTRYKVLGKIADLEESTSLIRLALTLRPPGHPNRVSSLNNLVQCLATRYTKVSRKMEDLMEAISLSREALSLCPPGHRLHALCMNGLAFNLFTRYEILGKTEDLEKSISLSRKALALQPPGHSDRTPSLNNLAHYLSARYDVLGKMDDLEESISLLRMALSLYAPGHRHRPVSLSNLADCLSHRHGALKKLDDIEECISLTCDALSLCSPGHPDYATALNNLSRYLFIRYEISDISDDLLVSVFFLRRALSLFPPGHSGILPSLENLAVYLFRCYMVFGKIEHLEESALLSRKSLNLCPPGHPNRCQSLGTLATALYGRYRHLSRPEDSEEAFRLYEQAASDGMSLIRHRLHVASEWRLAARDIQHASTLSAYTTILNLLNRSLVLRSSVESQQSFLATTSEVKSLASDAASAAIEAGNIPLAVEFLEQGRAILWSRINGYNDPFQQLREVEGGGELADRLKILGAELEHMALLSNSTATKSDKDNGVVTDAQIKRHRVLSEEWEELVERIRKIKGLSHFLKPPSFDSLQSAAAEGPVILVNISKFRSDAIIVLKDGPPQLVNLPEVELEKLGAQKLGSATEREIIIALADLWDTIVSPIADRLTELGIPKKSRIWWCPTAELCALPLHAAARGRKNFLDMYTSSYTSTLSSLIKARSNIVPSSSIPKLLVVGEPSTDLELKKVKDEVDAVKALVPPHNSVKVLFGSDAQSQAVIDGLKDHSWAHFACHGHLGDENQPFQASFQLHDRRLPVLDLMQARVPNAEFAFLSACHSAQGDSVTPDESIHLSAALQFCGFRSVIGTLWEMDDEDGPVISELFYKYMFRNPEKIDFRDSAHALNMAVKKMKKAGVPLDRLALFVHNGA